MSETLHVVATIPTDPNQHALIRPGITELAEATRAEEGCIRYDAYESTAVPGLFITVEEWRGQADLDAHMKTPHVAEAFELLGGALVGEVAIHPLQTF